MIVLKIIIWFFLFIIFYAYLGYGILLFILVRIKSFTMKNRQEPGEEYLPEVTLFVAAYNEKDFVDAKIRNSFSLDYPEEKVKHVWITDGSDDGTPDILRKYKGVDVYHQPERAGKIAAMNRGMQFVKTSIVIFSDGNTMLGKESVRRIVNLFKDPHVGCVSGEKRVFNLNSAAATEGIYWKYESTLKKWDAKLYSVVGAAGELFALRTELFKPVESDTLLDDFIISLRIAEQGYTIQYDPEAYAIENPSASVREELKRKIRISAGGIQSVIRLKELLNPFRFGILSFQYISHRVLRWTLAPLGLLVMLVCSGIITVNAGIVNFTNIYVWLFWSQLALYLAALLGWFFEERKIKFKLFYIPYYFFIMNLSVYLGFARYIKKQQSVNWERAKRG
ncbi:MAG: glycosyltransferase family 2 protein [Bacteroidetes bacterium]|nr:MAG: glycosyltransferase family 2 protein [Bacteroidota bacterium]